MATSADSTEMSMEEILASIRRYVGEENGSSKNILPDPPLEPFHSSHHIPSKKFEPIPEPDYYTPHCVPSLDEIALIQENTILRELKEGDPHTIIRLEPDDFFDQMPYTERIEDKKESETMSEFKGNSSPFDQLEKTIQENRRHEPPTLNTPALDFDVILMERLRAMTPSHDITVSELLGHFALPILQHWIRHNPDWLAHVTHSSVQEWINQNLEPMALRLIEAEINRMKGG